MLVVGNRKEPKVFVDGPLKIFKFAERHNESKGQANGRVEVFCATHLALANMNFFKTVFSDGPPPASGDPHAPDKPKPTPDLIQSSDFVWSFGGLIMTLASKS